MAEAHQDTNYLLTSFPSSCSMTASTQAEGTQKLGLLVERKIMEEGRDDLERERCKKSSMDMVMPDETDRISQLPNHVIHHILSLLSDRDMTCSSVLSKTWHGFWTSFPISSFEFNDSAFPLRLRSYALEDIRDRLVKFARFVHNSVLRQHRLNTFIQRFQLSTFGCSHRAVASHINKSLQMVIDCNVKELDLHVSMKCRVPPTVLSAKLLTVLRLARCTLMACPGIEWPPLREFYLYAVVIDELLIQNLSSTCPLLEKFSMVHCSGLIIVTLSGLRKLKKIKLRVGISSDCVVEKIEINIPSLEILNFEGKCPIDVAACRELQVLKLKSPTITGQVCQDIVSKLDDLKILVLCCPLLETIAISSKQLERVHFSSESLPKATIHTPVLQSVNYNFGAIRFPFSMNKTGLRKVSLKICFELDLYIFCRMREHLINFNLIKHLSLHIDSPLIRYRIPEDFNATSLPEMPDIKELKLKICSKKLLFHDIGELETIYTDLMDCLLWMCHPESLLLMSGWGLNDEFMKALCEKLLSRQREQNCCTSSNFGRCWKHALKDVEIEHHKGNGVKVSDMCCFVCFATV